MALPLPPTTTPEEVTADALVRAYEATHALDRATVSTAFLLWLIDAIGSERATCADASRAYIRAARASGELQRGRQFFALTHLHHHPANIVTPAFRRWTPHLMGTLPTLHFIALKVPPATRADMDTMLRSTVPPNNDDPTNTYRLTLQDYTGARAGFRRLLLYNGL